MRNLFPYSKKPTTIQTGEENMSQRKAARHIRKGVNDLSTLDIISEKITFTTISFFSDNPAEVWGSSEGTRNSRGTSHFGI